MLRLDDIHPLGATDVEFNHSGNMIATGGYLGEIYIWKIPEGKKLYTLKQHEHSVTGLIWVDDNTLLSASEDGQITLWDVTRHRILHTVTRAQVNSIVLLHDKNLIVSGHQDGRVYQWRYPDLKELASNQLGAAVRSIASNPKKHQLAIATEGSKLGIYSLKMKRLKSLPTAGKAIQELRYSPDGQQLAAGTWFDLLFWDLQSGKLSIRKTEHIGAIISLDYSPDGQHVVTLGRHTDANIRIRRVNADSFERRLRAHNLCGFHVRYGPNGKYVASASEDASVRLYDVSKPYNPTWGE